MLTRHELPTLHAPQRNSWVYPIHVPFGTIHAAGNSLGLLHFATDPFLYIRYAIEIGNSSNFDGGPIRRKLSTVNCQLSTKSQVFFQNLDKGFQAFPVFL